MAQWVDSTPGSQRRCCPSPSAKVKLCRSNLPLVAGGQCTAAGPCLGCLHRLSRNKPCFDTNQPLRTVLQGGMEKGLTRGPDGSQNKSGSARHCFPLSHPMRSCHALLNTSMDTMPPCSALFNTSTGTRRAERIPESTVRRHASLPTACAIRTVGVHTPCRGVAGP